MIKYLELPYVQNVEKHFADFLSLRMEPVFNVQHGVEKSGYENKAGDI
jgi:hypothetical protein